MFRNPYTWLGLALGIGLTVGWNVLQIQRYGDLFIQEHLGFHNIARVSRTLEGNDGRPWYYLIIIAKGSIPWILFWPGGLWLAWQRRNISMGRLVLAGNLLFLGMASAMGTKLPWYIMPIYPFMAMAVGWQLSRPLQEYAYSLRWLLGTLSLGGIGGIIYFAIADPQIPLILLGLCLFVTLLITTWLLIKRSPSYTGVLMSGLYSCLICLMLSHSWLWEVNESFPVKDIGSMILKHVPEGESVLSSYDYGRPSLEFYAERPVGFGSNESLKQRRQKGGYLLLEPDALEALNIPPEAVVDTADGFSLVKPQ